MNQKPLSQIGNSHDAGLAQRAPDDVSNWSCPAIVPEGKKLFITSRFIAPSILRLMFWLSPQVNRSFDLKLGFRAPQAELIDGGQSGLIRKLARGLRFAARNPPSKG